MRTLMIVIGLIIAASACVVYVPGLIITQAVTRSTVEWTSLGEYAILRQDFNAVIPTITDHFPISIPPPPAACDLYAVDHPLQGGMSFTLCVRTTPAEVQNEIQRLTMISQPMKSGRDSIVQFQLDRFQLQSSVSTPSSVLLCLFQDNDHVGLFWADPTTGEMAYIALVD